MQICGDVVEVRIPLGGRSAQWFEVATTLRVNGDVRADAHLAGATYVTNLGKQDASVEIVGVAGAGRTESLRPGEVTALSESRFR
jgi:hypothetical protein